MSVAKVGWHHVRATIRCRLTPIFSSLRNWTSSSMIAEIEEKVNLTWVYPNILNRYVPCRRPEHTPAGVTIAKQNIVVRRCLQLEYWSALSVYISLRIPVALSLSDTMQSCYKMFVFWRYSTMQIIPNFRSIIIFAGLREFTHHALLSNLRERACVLIFILATCGLWEEPTMPEIIWLCLTLRRKK